MKTRFRSGKFEIPFAVLTGDIFNLVLSSEYLDKSGAKQEHRQTVSEEINHNQIITHWAMFFIPGVGFGGCFGNEKLPEKLREMFPDGYEVPGGESVFIEI